MRKKPNQPKAHLAGIGLDNADGHKRITKADRFSIIGGSEKTHQEITETFIKTFETLDRKGKTLENVDQEELRDTIHKSRPE